jgi:hypothetical protein
MPSSMSWNEAVRRIAATIRNLCARDLLAWDGGAFAVTERGRFVLRHGPA